MLVEKLNYTRLSEIQQLVLDAHDSTKSLIVQSKNGSGKSFALTLLLLLRKPKLSIVIAPTREIAVQLHTFLSLFTDESVLLIGGLELKD